MATKGPHQCQRDTWAAYYASPDVVERFRGVVDALATEAEVTASTAVSASQAPEISEDLLATLTHNIQIAQENAYGRDGSSQGVKLPASLFVVPDHGVEETSPLYTILSAAIEYVITHGIDANAAQATSGSAARELVEAVRLKLADSRQLPTVRVFFAADVSSDKRTMLTEALSALGGSVVDAEHNATHVVDSSEVRSGQNGDEAWFRTLSRRDGKALVHWWYTPDSYDAWVATEPPFTAEPEDAGEHSGAWHVSQQWIEDSARFHEWLSEEDYEAGSSDTGGKRRAHAADGDLRARADGGNDTLPPGVTAIRTQEGPGRRRAEMEPVGNGDVANVSAMDVDTDAEAGTEAGADGGDSADAQLQREENARRLLVEQTQEIVIPSYAAWFRLSDVHENERRALPEFFNGRNMSKTPTVYTEYRNFMINSYRLSPSEYLTVTACRRNLAGDVCAIMRVHAFLEQWGLINYQTDADTKPSVIGPPFTGHFRISADTPRGLMPFQPSVSAQQLAAPDRYAGSPRTSAAPTPAALATRRDIYESPTIGDVAARPASETATAEPTPTTRDVFCHTCGVNCTTAYYHCVKALRQRVDLCAPCYMDGRFPGSLSSADFVKISDASGQSGAGDDWADQETLLLLEGVEMYDDDWNRIAEHVGSRSREECVLHFLKLPIVDPYEVAPLRADKAAQGAVVPFSRADNPVMSVVAFLAANVNPGVAAAAAKAALAELTKNEKTKAAKAKESDAEAKDIVENTNDVTEIKDNVDGKDDAIETKDSAENNNASSEAVDKDSMDVDSPVDIESKQAEHSVVPPESELAYASSVALGAAAAKAAKLAEYEERQLESMVHRAVELQMSKLELKMRQFEEMEAALEQERKDLARQRQQLVEECWTLKKKMSLFESGAAGRIAAVNGTTAFKADDNTAPIARPPTAQPAPVQPQPQPEPASSTPNLNPAESLTSTAPAAAELPSLPTEASALASAAISAASEAAANQTMPVNTVVADSVSASVISAPTAVTDGATVNGRVDADSGSMDVDDASV
ncbi:SWI/SNF and RSC complex subunit Ssr2 [Coemansia sp. RSA 1591]|nr:SWI/SNF and RSC complex subunit Ssr2 [Coemansia sp. RSA 1591]KAJ1793416.1 SWI/SNF and RSC complex subunit Ssr2 [Coemansia sp. RSA 1938]